MEAQCAGALPVRQYRYDNLKFFLIVLVVVGHFVDQYDAKSDVFKSLFVFIYSFHMPLFLFVSGLFTREKPVSVEKIIFYFILGYALKMLIYVVDFIYQKDPSFSVFSDSNITWYLFALSVFLILSRWLRSIKPGCLLPFWILFACFAGYDSSIADFLYLSRIIVFFPFFLAGYYLTPQKMDALLQSRVLKVIAFFIVFGFFFLCLFKLDLIYPLRGLFTGRNPYASVSSGTFGFFHRLLCYLISSVVGFSVIALMPKSRIPVISVFGTRTLQVYFLHKPIQMILCYSHIDVILDFGPPFVWKLLVILLAVVLPFLLSLKVFSYPFERMLALKRANTRSD